MEVFKMKEKEFDNGGIDPIGDLERDGWEIIDTFVDSDIIMARGTQRMVVDEDGEVIITY